MGLTDKQAEEISVEDLCRMIVAELQNREAMSPSELQHYTTYYPWNLSGIEEGIHASQYPHDENLSAQQEVRRKMAEKFAQARRLLYGNGLVYRDPTRRDEQFAGIAGEGKSAG